jgi:hypothetical protein
VKFVDGFMNAKVLREGGKNNLLRAGKPDCLGVRIQESEFRIQESGGSIFVF